jgi:hypothetical protein
MSFYCSCEHAELTPWSVIFGYAHLDDKTHDYPYLEQTVHINVERATVWYQSYRATSDSISAHQSTIDDYLDLPVGMYEALQIAEDNGGREVRSGATGYCEIRGGLGGLRNEGEWEVGYVVFTEDKSQSEWVLRVGIDATTGKARVISD